MEQYVSLAVPLLPETAEVRIYTPRRGDRRPQAIRTGVRPARPWAPWQWWDLIILADHLPLVFPPMDNAVLMSHGLVRAGRAPRGSYFYDRRRMVLNGRLVYATVCDPSERTAVEAPRFVPEVAGRVTVTGDLRVDRMLRCAATAPAGERPRLLVMSTWGSDSLFETAGPALFDELSDLHRSGAVAVTVTCHPNLLEPSTSLRDWPPLLYALSRSGVEVVDPSDPWEPVLAAADVVLTDHTSLGATFAVLRRPIIPVVCTPEPPDPDTFFGRLVAASEPWPLGTGNLAGAVSDALARGFPVAMEPVVDAMVDYVGTAPERFQAVFDTVLRCGDSTDANRHRTGRHHG